MRLHRPSLPDCDSVGSVDPGRLNPTRRNQGAPGSRVVRCGLLSASLCHFLVGCSLSWFAPVTRSCMMCTSGDKSCGISCRRLPTRFWGSLWGLRRSSHPDTGRNEQLAKRRAVRGPTTACTWLGTCCSIGWAMTICCCCRLSARCTAHGGVTARIAWCTSRTACDSVLMTRTTRSWPSSLKSGRHMVMTGTNEKPCCWFPKRANAWLSFHSRIARAMLLDVQVGQMFSFTHD